MYTTNYIPIDVSLLPPLITQRSLAKKMGVHYNTISTRHRKLKLLLVHYKECAQASDHLTRYQCWCQIQYQNLAIQFLNEQKLIVRYFRTKSHEFSLYQFNRVMKEKRA